MAQVSILISLTLMILRVVVVDDVFIILQLFIIITAEKREEREKKNPIYFEEVDCSVYSRSRWFNACRSTITIVYRIYVVKLILLCCCYLLQIFILRALSSSYILLSAHFLLGTRTMKSF